MGGLAFANVVTRNGKPPSVPRMSPELYRIISAECQLKLEKLFDRVVIPREAPVKVDYGDIDFLVEGIRPHTLRSNIGIAIKNIIGADLHLPRGDFHSYAIPHPEIPDAYVQIDVELLPGDGTPEGPELFQWTRYMKGDSDLLQVIGVSHRPLGLTCNDRGLHVRVEEIEPYNKKKALLFLTRDPNKAIKFYGFDADKYWAGFTDENDLFEWASSGRFFSHEVFENRVEKSNDRSRQTKRPMYRKFVEEYMAIRQGQGNQHAWTRQRVLEEALAFFDKHAEYDAMMREHHNKEAEENLWKDIRASLPIEGNSLALALKGLRRWVVFDNGEPRITNEPNLDEYQWWAIVIPAEKRKKVLDWVKENWEEIKALEKARARAAKAGTKRVLV
ncbi:Nn.00g082800.m01.CDS01 [Neocucurbitaria sp. VM-36]